MEKTAQLERDIRALVRTMDETKLTGDDEFIGFYEQYQALRKRLEEAPASPAKEQLAALLEKSFADLQGQLSFCTLH